MGAVAFTQTLVFKGANDNRTNTLYMTVSDVANEFAIAPDGNGFIQLPADQPYLLIDAQVVTGGTDTNIQKIFVNGSEIGVNLANKANLTTNYSRQFMTAPIGFKPGSLIRLKQTA